MITWVRFCLSYDTLKWDFIAFKMNVISVSKGIVDKDVAGLPTVRENYLEIFFPGQGKVREICG